MRVLNEWARLASRTGRVGRGRAAGLDPLQRQIWAEEMRMAYVPEPLAFQRQR